MAKSVNLLKPKHCEFCTSQRELARYDAKTVLGSWANMCKMHYLQYRFYRDLGTGKGQMLIYPQDVERSYRKHQMPGEVETLSICPDEDKE